MNEFSVTILGSSAATPTSTRFPSAQVVSHQYRPFLVDCGEGTQMQIRKNKIRFSKINHIFISHTHGDHFFGLIGLISSFNLLGRETDLHIYAPESIKAVLDLQLAVSESQLRYKIQYHFLKFDDKYLLYEDKQLKIYSFPLRHSIPTCGFLFKEKPYPRKIRKEVLKIYDIPDLAFEGIKRGNDFVKENGEIVSNETLTSSGMDQKSYVYCSDTAYFKNISDYLEDVDLLYHECSFMEDMRVTAEAKMHSTTLDAARTANNIGAKKLIIGHFSARYKELEPVLLETKTVFENTILASEDLKINI
ncbi:MAG: ribonuclease Z [Bacteroidales bacterium]|nr:ribonuclease Z [Bacteroidales bacterium]